MMIKLTRVFYTTIAHIFGDWTKGPMYANVQNKVDVQLNVDHIKHFQKKTLPTIRKFELEPAKSFIDRLLRIKKTKWILDDYRDFTLIVTIDDDEYLVTESVEEIEKKIKNID